MVILHILLISGMGGLCPGFLKVGLLIGSALWDKPVRVSAKTLVHYFL